MNKTDQGDIGYIKPLTGIRAIAAFMVFMMHYNPFERGQYPYSFFNQFYVGVSIFFVLSGFLITYRYYENYQLNKSWFLTYIRNRVARIYPVYFLITTVTFLSLLITDLNKGGTFSTMQIIVNSCWVYFANITFIRGFLDHLLFSLVPQGWSLSVEEFFYFSAPFTWLLVKRHFKLLYQAFFLLAIGLMLVYIGRYVPFYGFFDSNTFLLKFTYFGKAIQFFAGMWLAFQILKNPKKTGFLHTINKTYTGLTLVIICIVGLSVAWVYHYNYLAIFMDNVLLSFAIAIFLGGLITENTKVSAFLSTPLMSLLGKSSYAFYLIHVGVLQQLLDKYVSGNKFIQFLLLNLMAIAVYKWIESPLQMLIKGKRTAKEQLYTVPLPLKA